MNTSAPMIYVRFVDHKTNGAFIGILLHAEPHGSGGRALTQGLTLIAELDAPQKELDRTSNAVARKYTSLGIQRAEPHTRPWLHHDVFFSSMNHCGAGAIVSSTPPGSFALAAIATCPATILHGNGCPLSTTVTSTSEYPAGMLPTWIVKYGTPSRV